MATAASNDSMVFSPLARSKWAPWCAKARGPGQSRKGRRAMAGGTVASNLRGEVIGVPSGDERVTADDEMVVASPYDGAEIGRVPSCGATQVDRAVAAAKTRLGRAPPPH